MYISSTQDVTDDELTVDMHPGSSEPFGTINLGFGYIAIKTDGDAQRLIRAAGRLVAMRKMLLSPHPFEKSDGTGGITRGHCNACGMFPGSWAHTEPQAAGQ